MIFDTELIVTILSQVILFFIFISIFFFTYATVTEKSILVNQVDFVVDQTIGPFLQILCKTNDCSEIKQKVNEIDPSKLKQQDAQTEAQNKSIIKRTLIVLVIAIVSFFFIITGLYLLSKNKSGFFRSFDIRQILTNSAIILIFVGITEFVFLRFFGKRFIAVDINKIKIALLEKINGTSK